MQPSHNPITVDDALTTIKPQGRSELVVSHAREIKSGIHVSGPAEEEFVECRRGARTQRIGHAGQGDLRKKRLRARNGDKLELVRVYPRPVETR